MKYCRLLILLTLFTFLLKANSYAQQKGIKDSALILELINSADSLWENQPVKAQQIINDALNRSIQTNYAKGMALAYAKLGRWYFGSNINQSVEFAKKALSLFDNNLALPEEKADMHLLLAEAYDEQGHTDSSAYYYYLLGDEVQAGNINRPEFTINIYTKLAIFWININQNSKDEKLLKTTKEYVEKAIEISRLMKDTANGISSIYFLQGAYFHGINEFDSARIYYIKFLKSRERLNKLNTLRKISTETNIADTYLQQNRPQEAMVYINDIKKMGIHPNQASYLSFFMAFTGLQEGKALYQLKQYSASIQTLQEALQKLKTTGGHLRNEVVEAYKILADDFEAMNNYQQALHNKNIYITLKDSLTQKEKVDMISRLEIRYRIAEKNKELAQQRFAILEAGNKIKQKNIFIIGVLVLFVFLAILLMMWRKRNMHKQRLQQQNIENLQQKIKIERLNATIAGEEKERTRIARELHDGIGGLLTGAKMSFEFFKQNVQPEHEKEFQIGLKFLEDAGAELRQAAKNLMPQILLQDGLVKAVQAFCESISKRNNIVIHSQFLGEKKHIDSHLELTIYRIIQELVHNIVKHAAAKNAIVQINFHTDEGISITVEDDGIGFNIANISNQNKGGMGLKNIEERIKESGGKLDITSEEGQGTSFFIEFEPH